MRLSAGNGMLALLLVAAQSVAIKKQLLITDLELQT